jgi:hypothetical protein
MGFFETQRHRGTENTGRGERGREDGERKGRERGDGEREGREREGRMGMGIKKSTLRWEGCFYSF